MAYVITAPCIDVKDAACQVACPVDCIYEGGRMMYIQPDECISCGLCLSICPVDAIYEIADMPADKAGFTAVNREFFGPAVTGWGEPGGAEPRFVTTLDHPVVAAYPPVAQTVCGGVGKPLKPLFFSPGEKCPAGAMRGREAPASRQRRLPLIRRSVVPSGEAGRGSRSARRSTGCR